MSALMEGTLVEQDNRDAAAVGVLTGFADRAGGQRRAVLSLERPLRCVWSAHRANGCACDSRIPRDVVTAAWRDERESSGEQADRFFHFVWGEGVWLGYGLEDGRVRGVCCPQHGAERALSSEPVARRAGEPVLATAA